MFSTPFEEGLRGIGMRRSVRRITTRAGALGAILTVPLTSMALAVAAAAPPPDRAYELVSPADDPAAPAAGLSNDLFPLPGRASADGDRLVYGAGSVSGRPWSGATNPLIFGRRTESGWAANTAVRSMDMGDTPTELSSSEAIAGWMTDDATSLVFATGKHLGGVGAPGLFAGIYRANDDNAPPAWLSRPLAGIPEEQGEALFAVTADNNNVVAFQSQAPLTSDAPPLGTWAVYVRRGDTLELVSRLPGPSGGAVPSDSANLANRTIHASSSPAVGMRNQLADNGRFVLFTLGGTASQGSLLVRDLDRDETYQLAGGAPGATDEAYELRSAWGTSGQFVDADRATVPEGLVYAASAAPRAFFKTLPTLTNPALVYEADLESGDLTPRPAITGPPLGLSPDGRQMVFLAPPASGSDVGDWSLRYWDASQPNVSAEIGTVSNTAGTPFGMARVYRLSKDGKTWVFTAIDSLDPARPNVSPQTQQLYRWSVGDTSPTCLTCVPLDGVARTSGVNLTVQESVVTEKFVTPTIAGDLAFDDNKDKVQIAQPGHSLSDDGRWLLFDSPDRFVPQDTNDVRDVYLWDREAGPGGRLQLVTSGTGNFPSYALDLDPTGKNAFFSTREGLVPADSDGVYDVYNARIGGGDFLKPELPCAGERECRVPVILDPPLPNIGSVSFGGDGNVPLAPANASVGVSKLKAVIGSAAKLKVRVPDAGRISVAGSSVRRTSKSATKAGTYSVKIKLSSKARKSLKRKKTLKVNVRVAFKAKDGQSASKTIAVTFKQPKAKRAQAKAAVTVKGKR